MMRNLNCWFVWSMKGLCKVGLPGSCLQFVTSSSRKHWPQRLSGRNISTSHPYHTSIHCSGPVRQITVYISEEWGKRQRETSFTKVDANLQTEMCGINVKEWSTAFLRIYQGLPRVTGDDWYSGQSLHHQKFPGNPSRLQEFTILRPNCKLSFLHFDETWC